MNPDMKKITPTPEFEAKFRARYEALHPQIDGRRYPGDRNWLDRVSSWDLFASEYGEFSAECLRAAPRQAQQFPELAELVLEAWPEKPRG